MKKRSFSLLIAFLFSLACLCSCSKPKEKTIYDYLGDYSYSESAECMVYEPVEGETDDNGDQCYGIQYREITDLNGLLTSGNTLLIYFYSSMSNESAAVTASMEDVAQLYYGKITVLMLDVMEFRDMMEKYEIEAVPEFVLIKAGQADQVFDSASYGYWTVNDVISWLQLNGVN